MKFNNVLSLLLKEEIISPPQYNLLENHEKTKPLSIHWEARFFLVTGISLLSTGLGILIYTHIETIANAIRAIIA